MTDEVFKLDRRRFSVGLAASALAACGPQARSAKDADVVIIGAGLSGLFAAMWLRDAGYKVIVLEAAERIGGRLWTLDDLPGRPEAGGSQVGQSYARIRFAADKLGLRIIDDIAEPRGDRLLSIAETHILQSAWPQAPQNVFPDALQRAAPDSVLFAAAARENPFDWPGAWRTPEAFAVDQSAEEFLRAKGFNEEALRQVNVALNANDLSTYSMLNLWRTLQLYAQDASAGPSGGVEGGAQRLPEAMAQDLGDAVRTGLAADAIEVTDEGVAVSAGGERVRADFCIVSVPFPALRDIAITPSLSGAQADAVAALPYTQIVQLHLEPAEPFWESDGLPAAMWTDGPLERVFTTKDRETREIVGLLSWINGERARELGATTDDALADLVRSEFARIRPASGGDVGIRKIVRWTENESFAGGAYMHWAPGQAEAWATTMGAPVGAAAPGGAPRIHFAGEHLSYLHTGMEGAMESGQRAAEAIIEASTS